MPGFYLFFMNLTVSLMSALKRKTLTALAGIACCTVMSSFAAESYRPPIIMDGHQDILLDLINPQKNRRLDVNEPKDQANFELWEKGGINSIFFAVWIDPTRYPKERAVDRTNALIDCFYDQVKMFPDKLAFCQTADEVRAAVKAGKLAGLLGIEGGCAINDDISNLKKFRERGVRYMTLTWRGNLSWAGSSQLIQGAWAKRTGKSHVADNPTSGGLTDFGRDVIREMNSLGIIPDISHVSDQTFMDTIEVSSKPVIVSHSNCRALSKHDRNISDDMLRALKKNGGVIGMNFWYETLEPNGLPSKNEKATSVTVATVADHIDHVVKIAGIDHVGIGSDYDGMSDLPHGLEKASGMPLLFAELAKRGYSKADMDKIAGENFLRVLKANDGGTEK